MAEELEPHIVENYKIVQRLGKGAYGVVWRAVDNKTNEQVAIKKVGVAHSFGFGKKIALTLY